MGAERMAYDTNDDDDDNDASVCLNDKVVKNDTSLLMNLFIG